MYNTNGPRSARIQQTFSRGLVQEDDERRRSYPAVVVLYTVGTLAYWFTTCVPHTRALLPSYAVVFGAHRVGIAGRRPYGISTKMLELIGWTRFELNRVLRFQGVTEQNFQSILRRSFVWKPKARFFDPSFLDAHYPNHADDGVFKKDAPLNKFLVSGPAIAAGLMMQHGFEASHSRDQCAAIIEEYAALGGGGGRGEDRGHNAGRVRAKASRPET